jgi:ankyrin repeat protein
MRALLALWLAAAPPQPAVFGLIAAGDVAGVTRALTEHPELVNAEGVGGMTPLGAAIGRRNVAIIRALLDGGADADKPFGPTRMRPLQAASARGLAEVVSLLLDKGVDPNGKDASGGTALHEAARLGSVEIASLLAGKAADVNAAYTAGPDAGATPVHLAARLNSVPLMIVFAAHRPNWAAKWNGRTPEEIAVAAGATDVADYIRAKRSGGATSRE